MAYERELSAARRWADETDGIALEHFRAGAPAETKDDGTPVTAGDRAVEEHLRAAITREFPGDAVLGEEGGATGSSRRRWVIDPIDGTRNFARGIPVWATLVALQAEVEGERAGVLALGVVSAPALGTRWWAADGGGAFRDGEPIRVSRVARLEDADLCTGGLDWARAAGEWDRFERLLARVRRHRGFGDFWGAMLVAQGSMDAMVEFAPLELWDVAAPSKILVEAGGRATNIQGENGVRPSPIVSSNGILHEELLTLLRS